MYIKSNNKRSLNLFIFIFFLSIYLLMASGILHHSDSEVQINVARNFIEHGSINLIPKPGYKIISNIYIMGVDGKFYSKYGILPSIIYMPGVIISKMMSHVIFKFDQNRIINFISSLWGQFFAAYLCTLFFATCLSLNYTRKLSFILTLILGFCTVVFHFSKDSYTQLWNAAFILTAMYFAISFFMSFHWKSLAFSGLFILFSIATRPMDVIVVIPITIYIYMKGYMLWQSKDRNFLKGLTAYFLILLVGAILIGWYNFERFGFFLETGYHISPLDNKLLTFNLNKILINIYYLFLSPSSGLFIYMPLLVISLFCIKKTSKKYRFEAFLLYGTCGVFILFYSLMGLRPGGISHWSNVYILEIVPLLILPTGVILDGWPNIKHAALIAFLIALSFIIQISSVLVSTQGPWYDYINSHAKHYQDVLVDEAILNRPFIIYQWKKVWDIATISQEQKNRLIFNTNNNVNVKEITTVSYSLNSFSFWWIYAIILGLPKYIIVSILLLLIVLASCSLYYILRYI